MKLLMNNYARISLFAVLYLFSLLNSSCLGGIKEAEMLQYKFEKDRTGISYRFSFFSGILLPQYVQKRIPKISFFKRMWDTIKRYTTIRNLLLFFVSYKFRSLLIRVTIQSVLQMVLQLKKMQSSILRSIRAANAYLNTFSYNIWFSNVSRLKAEFKSQFDQNNFADVMDYNRLLFKEKLIKKEIMNSVFPFSLILIIQNRALRRENIEYLNEEEFLSKEGLCVVCLCTIQEKVTESFDILYNLKQHSEIICEDCLKKTKKDVCVVCRGEIQFNLESPIIHCLQNNGL